MIDKITSGQYFPVNSAVHRLDPRMKIIMTMLYIVILFLPDNLPGLLVGGAFGLSGYLISGISLKLIIRGLRPVIPVIIFTAILNMFFAAGEPLFHFWILTLTREGIVLAVLMMTRIICLIAGTSLLTYTTSPIALTDGIEQLLKPFSRIGLPAHELAMMMTIALRFIPTLIEETQKIMSAQKARGADMESGGLIRRSKALIPILVPLFVSSFRRADELALAMECRCYHGGEGRTRMKQLRYSPLDGWALAYTLLSAALVVAMNFIFPSVY
jgi:energy-coupling factor transport system permease protein